MELTIPPRVPPHLILSAFVLNESPAHCHLEQAGLKMPPPRPGGGVWPNTSEIPTNRMNPYQTIPDFTRNNVARNDYKSTRTSRNDYDCTRPKSGKCVASKWRGEPGQAWLPDPHPVGRRASPDISRAMRSARPCQPISRPYPGRPPRRAGAAIDGRDRDHSGGARPAPDRKDRV